MLFFEDIAIPMLIIGAMGALLGLILSIAEKVFEVQEDLRIKGVYELLPHYDCGACGYPGCQAFAQGLVEEEFNRVSLCRPSNPSQREAIMDYMNTTPGPNGEIFEVTI